MDSRGELPEEQSHISRALSNPRDFAPLYDHYAPRVYKFYRYRVNDIATAQDLTAKTFERALADIRRYQAERAPFAAWLFGIANNTFGSYYRAEQRRHTPLDDLSESASDEPSLEQAAIAAETSARVAQAVSQLREHERELIALKFAAGLPNTQIAVITQQSESNVGVALYRSLQKLRRILAEEISYGRP